MTLSLLMAGASALVIGNSLFFGAYIWNADKKNKLTNQLLALLLLALAVRISKSVILILFPNASEIFPAIGLIGMAAIGPFLYLHLRSVHRKLFSFGIKEAVHISPSVAIALMLPMDFVDDMVIYRFYQFVVSQMLFYLILSYRLHRSSLQNNKTEPLIVKWGYILIGGITLIWTAFFIQLVYYTFELYLLTTTLAAFLLYGISFWVMKNRPVFKNKVRLSKINGDADAIYKKIKKALENEKIYQDPDITLDKLADIIKCQPYLVSLVVNESFGKSFPELINTYRIAEAQKLLESKENEHLSVESIAYESGFNSISSFYSSFKKISNITPAEYRKRYL